MSTQKHLQRLEQNHMDAPANRENNQNVEITPGRARVSLTPGPAALDASGNVDRALYYKALSDAATLAAGSVEEEHEVVQNMFNLYITRPVSPGPLVAQARVIAAHESAIRVDTVLFNERGEELAHGYGVFTRGDTAPESPPETPSGENADQVIYQVVFSTPFGLIYPN